MAHEPEFEFVKGMVIRDKRTGMQIASLDSSLFVQGSPYNPEMIGLMFSVAPQLLDMMCDALVFVEDAMDDPVTKEQARKLSTAVRLIIDQLESRPRG